MGYLLRMQGKWLCIVDARATTWLQYHHNASLGVTERPLSKCV